MSPARVADVAVPEGVGLTFAGFVSDIAARHGGRPALVFEGRAWSYEALAAQVRACAVACSPPA